LHNNSTNAKKAALLREGHGRRQKFYGQAALLFLSVVEVAGLVVMTQQSARAYVDPGSGFLAFQMVGASLAGAAFVLRRRLRRLFRRDREQVRPDALSDIIDRQVSPKKAKNPIVS